MYNRYAPPLGYTPPEGQQNLGPAEWDALVASGLQFAPYDGATHLSSVRGDCLGPLIVSGRDMLRLRAMCEGEPLIDGGLYSIAWAEESETQAYRERIGITSAAPIRIVKMLRYLGGTWYCQCKDSIAQLNGEVVAQVVGVIPAHIEHMPAVHARQLMGCGADTGQLGANAATTIYLATNTFAGITASGTTGQNNTNIGFTIGTPPKVDCTVIVTVVVACHQSAGAGTIKIMIGYDDTGGTSYSWSVPEVLVSTTSATYTLQYQYTHSAANLTVPRVVLGWDSSSATNVLTADGYETFQSEYIKR